MSIIKFDPRNKIETAVRRIGGNSPAPPFDPPGWLETITTHDKARSVSLPRICAIAGKPYLAHYVLDQAGVYRHTNCGEVTRAMSLMFGLTKSGVIKSAEIGQETCPHCGSCGRGAVRCPCGKVLCRGTVVDNRTLHCISCGSVGEIQHTRTEEVGTTLRWI